MSFIVRLLTCRANFKVLGKTLSFHSFELTTFNLQTGMDLERYKLQVTSYKLQVTSHKSQATSYKLQFTSYKLSYNLQVTSYKLQVTILQVTESI
jgi:hypothetical protein